MKKEQYYVNIPITRKLELEKFLKEYLKRKEIKTIDEFKKDKFIEESFSQDEIEYLIYAFYLPKDELESFFNRFYDKFYTDEIKFIKFLAIVYVSERLIPKDENDKMKKANQIVLSRIREIKEFGNYDIEFSKPKRKVNIRQKHII